MTENLPVYISIVFIISTVLTLGISFWIIQYRKDGTRNSNAGKILAGLLLWIVLQGALSISNVYADDIDLVPPKIFIFGILPAIIMIIWLFGSTSGKSFIDNIQIKKLTYLHLVRIPVEFVLFWLFLNRAIPRILTFEGWNYDIIMGVTAPLIIYFGFKRKVLSRNMILVWNVVGFFLLIFVLTLAILSSPFPLQKLAFDQPNVGLLRFPFSWLPTFIVPVVLLGHLISIRQLIRKG